jgi:hypothetical protein
LHRCGGRLHDRGIVTARSAHGASRFPGTARRATAGGKDG